MSETINGIDVSEEIRYCNNCSNLGLDFKTGKFYCGLSNRKDELPEILSCENFSLNYYIKRLQEENKELKDRNANLRLNLATYDLPEIKKILTDWRTGELDKKFKNLQKEKEELKKYHKGFVANCRYCDEWYMDKCNYIKKENKYRQALEEIRGIIEFRFKTAYMTLGLKETDKIIEDIEKIANEVMNDRD